MAQKTNVKIIFRIILLVCCSIILTDCASQLSPGGGDVDIIPPEITDVYPANGTTNFQDDHIELQFSEYVDKTSLQAAVFISPAFDSPLEYDWNGASVNIKFPEKLKDSITYVFTIGTDLVDLNNHNRMAKAFSLKFSTGGRIDRGMIFGNIYDENPSGTMLYAYTVNFADTVDPSKMKPVYVSQTGKDGAFQLPGLAFGYTYRIFAVKDEFKDFLYHIGDNHYGAPYRDVILSENDSLFKNLNFFLAQEDTISPRLLSAAMTDRFHILAEFSEPVDSLLYPADNFYLSDSTADKKIIPKYCFRGRGKRNEMVLSVADSLSEHNNIFLIANNITDKTGNKTNFDYTRLTVTAKPDTSAPVLIKTIPPDRSNNIDVKSPGFSFFYDDGFDSLKLRQSVNASDKAGAALPIKISMIDDASFTVRIMAELKPGTDYSITINLKNLSDAAGNRTDSVYRYTFATFSGQEFTGVSGIVIPGAGMTDNNIQVVLQNIEKDKPVYKKKTGKKHEFDFNKVEPGKYQIWSYQGKDSASGFSFGRPYPFIKSDRFIFYPDTLNLRARWPVSDVIIRY
ncbi:MAG: Ig-like domain-containing protein [Ignavibacteria bacterium]